MLTAGMAVVADTPGAQPPTSPQLSCVVLLLAMLCTNAYS